MKAYYTITTLLKLNANLSLGLTSPDLHLNIYLVLRVNTKNTSVIKGKCKQV